MILLTFGTRPEYLKIKPLIKEFIKNNIDYKILFTGQHLNIADFKSDYVISIKDGENRLDSIVSSIMNELTSIIRLEPTLKYVLVQGDTTSVLAVALSAFHHQIKVIHLEAGLRTFDKKNPYPEETNRRIVSSIADIHLCPTDLSKTYLEREKTEGDIYVVGNTGLDNLLPWKEKLKTFTGSNDILITLHRRENHHWMKEWFLLINEIAKKHNYLNFIFPMHPNPKVQINKVFIDAPNIKIIEPLDHDELLDVLVNSRLVITDSGGIQEECSFLNKICLTCRKVTERPEAIGYSTRMVKSPLELPDIFEKYINNSIIKYESPFGDGHASEKIVKILKEL